MATYAVEKLENCLEELVPLLELHWEEIALHKDKIKLNPDYSRYLVLEQQGVCHTVVVRGNTKQVIGYFISFVVPHLHYSDHLWAMNDIMFLHPDHRGGRTALKMMKFAEARLKELGVSVIQLHMKTDFPFERLAKFCGYDKVEYNYSKFIGD